MLVDNLVTNTAKSSIRSPSARDREHSETFQNVLERTMKSSSDSRSQKIEMSGILIPCHQKIKGKTFKFKLGASQKDYWLTVNDRLAMIARNAEWEEVTVRGYLNLDDNVLDVERITLIPSEEPAQIPSSRESIFDVEAYKRVIRQRGKLEPALEYLAS